MLNLAQNRSLKVLATMMVGWILLAVSPWTPVAHATTVTPCSDDEVTVMIEGYPLACSPAGGTGWQTLVNAGFAVEGTQKFPEFICRINSYPDAGVDKCLTASPAHAYWSYWHAPLGGDSWEYSDLGAMLYQPQAGTVEAWTWGAGAEPGAIPVSRSTLDENPDADTGATAGTGGGGDWWDLPDIPALPTFPDFSQGQTTAATTRTSTPTPEANPENPDEVLVFLDANGNTISREEYEQLIAAAQSAQTRTAPTSAVAPAPGAPAPQAAGTTTAPTTTPKSTRVMAAPALPTAPATAPLAGDAAVASPQYAPTTAEENTSQAWIISLTVAFIVLLGGAAAATWVLRRKEING